MSAHSGPKRSLVADGTKETNDPVSVGTTATLISAVNKTRRALIIQPTDGDLYVGDSTVTTANGILVPSGTIFTDTVSEDEWYGIVSSSTVDTRVLEVS